MFHRYVTHNGEKIDYDRAAWLMDKGAFEKAKAGLPIALGVDPFDVATSARMGHPTVSPKTPAQELQALWDLYCIAHESKFGRPFNPEVM